MLKLKTAPIIISSWDDEDGEIIDDTRSTHDGMDEDSNASVNLEFDGGESVEYGIEQASTEYISNDYGRGDTDEWLGSSTGNNSKECRLIEL